MRRAGEAAARIGSLRPADPRVRRGLYVGIAIIVVFGVVLAAVSAAGDLPDIEWSLRPWALALATASMVALLLCGAGIWRRLLKALGPELDPARARAIWFTSGLGRYVPTGLLLPVLRVAMSEREGVPKRICLASVTYELALSLTAGLIVAAYFVIDLPELGGQGARYLVVALPVVALVLLHPRVFHYVADFALEQLGRPPLPLALPFGRVLAYTAQYAGTYVLGGLAVYGIASCVYPVDAGDLVVVIGAFAVANVVSFLAPVLPGGLVAREAGMALALAAVMPAAPALAVAVLSRILHLTLESALAVVTPLLARR
jgi:uncharacterized membrane protein YbhN (UPF0104 family)